MSKDEIIAMAKEAGFPPHIVDAGANRELARFAALVAAREREKCAQLAMEFRRGAGDPVCGEVAASIRARGKP